MTIDWHFPRTQLAQGYLDSFDAGLVAARAIFAPRRKGKTEFLLRDLAPAAQKRGFAVVYFNFWSSREDPRTGFIAALAREARRNGSDSFARRLRQVLRSPVRKLNLEVEIAGVGKLGAEAQPDAPPASTSIDSALEELAQQCGDQPLLLLLDEVQFLAKASFENFVAELRTALDSRRQRVKVLFAGSSRVRLQNMFRHVRAPLFQFGDMTDFPDLGVDYVRHTVAVFLKATGRQLDAEEVHRAFVATRSRPGLLADALDLVMKSGVTRVAPVLLELDRRAQDEADFDVRYLALRDIERHILNAVALGMPPFSQRAKVAIALELGVPVVSKRMIQYAVQRLVEEQFLFPKEGGGYEVEDPGLANWLQRRLQFGPLAEGQ